MECLYAYTPPGGAFPPYLNMSFDGDAVIVTVRSGQNAIGLGGASASIRVPADEFFAHINFTPTVPEIAPVLMIAMTREERIEERARICHEANRAWCEFNGDTSQLGWDEAPAWQRESAIAGVRFHLDNPNAGDSASHDSWMAEKFRTGWTYGPVKDADLKQHPCMVSFDQLDPMQQFKDRLFRSLVHASDIHNDEPLVAGLTGGIR